MSDNKASDQEPVSESAASEQVVPVAEVAKPRARVSSGFGVRITSRDLEILEFVNDMKFANLEVLHLRFFSRPRGGGTSKSTWWARERIQALRSLGLVKPVRIYTEGQSYFVATDLAFHILSSMKPERLHAKPLESIDIRSFEHDKRILYSRVALELGGRAKEWFSERRLKSEQMFEAEGRDIGREYQPDAIYTNAKGDRVAFELELSFKSRERYEKKFRTFDSLFRYDNKPLFKNCLIVASTAPMYRLLKGVLRKTVGDSERFRLVSFEELVKPIGVVVPGAVARAQAEPELDLTEGQ